LTIRLGKSCAQAGATNEATLIATSAIEMEHKDVRRIVSSLRVHNA
jgi:hypothetical protein